jgi:hypothetical protein
VSSPLPLSFPLFLISVHPTLQRLGDLKGIFVRFQEKSGVIILSFHDLRHALRAHRAISSQPLFGLETPCSTAFITPEHLITVRQPFSLFPLV